MRVSWGNWYDFWYSDLSFFLDRPQLYHRYYVIFWLFTSIQRIPENGFCSAHSWIIMSSSTSVPHHSHPNRLYISLVPNDTEAQVHTFRPWLSSIKWMIYYSHLLFLLSSLLIFITPSYHLHQLIITVISTTTTAILLMSSSFIPTVATSIHISMFVFHYCRKRKGGCSWLPTPLVLLDQRFIQLSCHLFYRIHISQQTKDNTDNTSLP